MKRRLERERKVCPATRGVLRRLIVWVILVGGLAYDHVTIDIEDVGTLATQLRQSRVDVLYIAPVRALDVADIAAICHNMGHITLTGVPRYVAKGVAIGMDMKGDSLELLVNRRAIRQASADLSSRVLALARIVD